jgi:hypothetical protein
MIPGPGYPVALLVKYARFNKLLIPVSNLNILYVYAKDKSKISYEGIAPATVVSLSGL